MWGMLVRKKSTTGYMTLTAIAGIVGFVEHHGMMAVRGEGAKKMEVAGSWGQSSSFEG